MTIGTEELIAHWEEAFRQCSRSENVEFKGELLRIHQATIEALKLLQEARMIHLASGGIPADQVRYTRRDVEALVSIVSSLERTKRERDENDGRYTQLPRNVGQAELMVKLGYSYLKEYAPERLKQPDADVTRLTQVINNALQLKGGWREAIVELEDFCSEPVRLNNMLAAADQLDRWAEQAQAAVKAAQS